MRMQKEGDNIQLRSLLHRSMLPSPRYCRPSNPVCSRPRAEVCTLRASTICTLSLLDSGSCGGALLEAVESDLKPTLAFLSTKITLKRAQLEFWADQPAALCLMRTNRVCAGWVGALFFLSETGMSNSRACHNTPE